MQSVFPNDRIVSDRFHVIRLVLATFHEFCKAKDPNIRWRRGITAALRTKGANLRDSQKLLLQKEFELHPAIKIAHEFKEELCSLLNIKEQKRINRILLLARLKDMVWQMRHDAPKPFKKLGLNPIIRMWRCSKSNGITEGGHRKKRTAMVRFFVLAFEKGTALCNWMILC